MRVLEANRRENQPSVQVGKKPVQEEEEDDYDLDEALDRSISEDSIAQELSSVLHEIESKTNKIGF